MFLFIDCLSSIIKRHFCGSKRYFLVSWDRTLQSWEAGE